MQICARLRPGELVDPAAAAKYALRRIARRGQFLSEEIRDLDARLRALVTAAAPHLLVVPGVGIEVAGQLLVTAGDNPDRLRTEASFARLCGVPPLKPRQDEPDATGSAAAATATPTTRYTPLRCAACGGDPRTRAYVTRRIAQGRSTPEIIGCLKRYITREIYRLLTPDRTTAA